VTKKVVGVFVRFRAPLDAFNDPLIDNKDSKEDIEPMF
jgi:hypothetical protein